METDLMTRINRLKQDLYLANTHNPKKSEDLAAYLSQSVKKPSTPELQTNQSSPHFKAILDEKQARINELEDEVSYLRENFKAKEQDLISKYEKSIESIKNNCDSLVNYYETQFQKIKFYTDGGNIDVLIENLNALERENKNLKSQIKSQNTSFIREKNNFKQDFSGYKEKANDTVDLIQNKEGDESLEVEDLKEMKNKLEKEIANMQRSKSEYMNEVVEDYDEKVVKAVKIAEMYKNRANQLALKLCTFLRSLKIDLFEIKNEILSNFEDASTHASSVVTRLFKKYKLVIFQ